MKKTTQTRPGHEKKMSSVPVSEPAPLEKKLNGKVVLITGGDSGIGKAVAILFAQQGANVAISYLNEHDDATNTQVKVEAYGQECLLIPGDLSKEAHCKKVLALTMRRFKKLDVLVNNAAIHYAAKTLEEITSRNFLHSFQVNFSVTFS